MRRTLFVLLLLSLTFSVSFAKDEETSTPTKSEKFKVTDIVTKPVEMILAPIMGREISKIITAPAEALISPVFDLGEAVSTPGRIPEYVTNINKNVTVITAEEIKISNPRNIQELLSKKSGLMINGYFGNAKDNNVDMRGFGETGLLNYVVLVDGRRMNQIDLSGADLAQVDVGSIERIEIVKGANSVLYGDNATGGVINIITKKGKPGHRITYQENMGSFGSHKEYVSLDGEEGFMSYFFNCSHKDSDGYRVNNRFEADDFFASVTMRPIDALEIEFSSAYHRDWYGQPGALYPGNIQSDGREASRYPNDRAKTEDYYFTLVPTVYSKLGNSDLALSVLTSYRSRRTASVSKGWGNPYEIGHQIDSFEFKPKVEVGSFIPDWRIENKAVIGIDYFRAMDRILSGDVTLTKQKYDISKETFGVYASDNMLIAEKILLNAGVRGEWAEYIFDQSAPAMSYNTRSLREAAFEVGAGYKYNDRSQVYSNYSRSYRFPATDEYFSSAYEFVNWSGVVQLVPATLNTGLKQQVANNVEIGVKDRSFEKVAVDAAYYFIDTKNEIYYDPISYMNTNYHNTIRHGFECEFSVEFADKVKGFGGYNFQKVFFVGEKFAGNELPLVPRNKVTAGFVLGPWYGVTMDMSSSYVGDRYAASDQVNSAAKIKSHITVDAGVVYEVGNLRFFGSVKNLLGKEYLSNGTKDWQGNIAFYPAPERTFEFGVSATF